MGKAQTPTPPPPPILTPHPNPHPNPHHNPHPNTLPSPMQDLTERLADAEARRKKVRSCIPHPFLQDSRLLWLKRGVCSVFSCLYLHFHIHILLYGMQDLTPPLPPPRCRSTIAVRLS